MGVKAKTVEYPGVEYYPRVEFHRPINIGRRRVCPRVDAKDDKSTITIEGNFVHITAPDGEVLVPLSNVNVIVVKEFARKVAGKDPSPADRGREAE